MVAVAQFIYSIEHLAAASKAAVKMHVDDFEAKLDADCDELFKERMCQHRCMLVNAQQSGES